MEWSIRREDLLEARPMEEAIAGEVARVREEMNGLLTRISREAGWWS